MKRQYRVLTALGPDRAGIVRDVAAVLRQSECNLEDSRMALLAGKFALVVLFSGSEKAVAQIEDLCEIMKEQLALEEVRIANALALETLAQHRYELRLSGIDAPGIVLRTSEVLADAQINVTSMESRVTHAAFSGTAIFSMHAELAIPHASVVDDVKAHLKPICDDLSLSMTLEPIDSET